jgi:hypothetical protein
MSRELGCSEWIVSKDIGDFIPSSNLELLQGALTRTFHQPSAGFKMGIKPSITAKGILMAYT